MQKKLSKMCPFETHKQKSCLDNWGKRYEFQEFCSCSTEFVTYYGIYNVFVVYYM